MTDSNDIDDPEKLREEVEQEILDLTEEAADEEIERMAERDREGVDEPHGQAGDNAS